jgi:hypothetical protein
MSGCDACWCQADQVFPILLALWLLGFFVRAAEGARWYRW